MQIKPQWIKILHKDHAANCDCKASYFSTLNVIDALGAMKGGKNCDEDGIFAEHLHHAPLNFLECLTLLLNLMLKHAFADLASFNSIKGLESGLILAWLLHEVVVRTFTGFTRMIHLTFR